VEPGSSGAISGNIGSYPASQNRRGCPHAPSLAERGTAPQRDIFTPANAGFSRPVAFTGAVDRSMCSFLDSWYCSNGSLGGSVARCRCDIRGTEGEPGIEHFYADGCVDSMRLGRRI
jgi:hypothetical protein